MCEHCVLAVFHGSSIVLLGIHQCSIPQDGGQVECQGGVHFGHVGFKIGIGHGRVYSHDPCLELAMR